MKTKLVPLFIILALLSTLNLQPSAAHAEGTAFTYNGRLNDSGQPATGIYDLRFSIYDATTNGNVYGVLTNAATGVTNGLFTATLDFGGVFNGSNYWLEIAARTNGGTSFSTLSPRQPITPTPYAIYSANAGSAATAATAGTAGSANSVSAANIVGTLSLVQLPAVVQTNAAQLNIPNTTTQATAGVIINSGFITDTTITNHGAGYTTAPLVTITDVSGSNAVITATVANGVVTSLSVQNPGTHYSSGATLTIAPPPSNAYQTFGSGNIFNGVNSFNNPSNTFAGSFSGNVNGSFAGNAGGLTNVNAANLTGANALPAGVLPANVAFLNSNQTYTGVNTFTNRVVFGRPNPLFTRSIQFRPQANCNLDIDVYGGGNGMTIESVDDYNSVNQMLEIRCSPVVFTFPSVGIGTYSPATALDVNGSVTLSGNLYLPATTATAGIIYSGGNPLIHSYGYLNFFAGSRAGNLTMSGSQNAAFGAYALSANTSGGWNTAIGQGALQSNTTGNNNSALGQAALVNNTTGYENTASGSSALWSNSTGNDNTANGNQALSHNTTGNNNTAIGAWALVNNTIGNNNTAVGFQALLNNTNGWANEAFGQLALFNNTSGYQNMASGDWALYANTTGYQNAASGSGALQNNTVGSLNTAAGFHSLFNNTTAGQNTANGYLALLNNTTGDFNTANGSQSLRQNTIGYQNTANGAFALVGNISGNFNTANGLGALNDNTSGNNNTADGLVSLYNNTTGNNNIALGYQAGYNIITGSSNIDIGNMGLATDTNIIRIGSGQTQAFIAGVINGNGGGLTNVNTGPSGSSALGNEANGYQALVSDTTGGNNTANGSQALRFNTTGGNNTANGFAALFLNRGNNNIAEGYQAGYNITTGSSNIDIGNMGLATDTNIIRIGSGQTQAFIAGQIVGDGSGLTNLNGASLSGNVALSGNLYLPLTGAATGIIYQGGNPLIHTYGFQNFFAGIIAGNLSTTGAGNTGIGNSSLSTITSGIANTAIGQASLFNNSTGSGNTAIGQAALISNLYGSENTAIGHGALQSNSFGTNNIGIGLQGGYNVASDNNIDIGNQGMAADTSIIRIGDVQTQAFIAGVITGNGAGLTNVPASAVSGGITANIPVLVAGGTTNILCFTNGVLMAVQ